jgi:hypothetical protein
MSTLGSAAEHLSPATRRRSRDRVASMRLRLRVLARRERLDRMLLEGADPVTSAELTLRAFQLTRPPGRAALAAGIEDAVSSAGSRRRRSPSAAPLARSGIAAARPELAELARALREEPIVSAHGVVLARRLLTDGSGPLYGESGDGALRSATMQALNALGDRV